MNQELMYEQERQVLYQRKGQSTGAVGAIIMLIVGVGIAALVLIFVGTLGGQTYQLTEAQIDTISNATIRNYVKGSIISAFSALNTTGTYLPIIVLAVVIAVVLSLVLGFTALGGGRGGGSAL